jgi:hypothetical protein
MDVPKAMWLRKFPRFDPPYIRKFDAQRAIISKTRKIVFVVEMVGTGEHERQCAQCPQCVA